MGDTWVTLGSVHGRLRGILGRMNAQVQDVTGLIRIEPDASRHASKACEVKASEGSNPSATATAIVPLTCENVAGEGHSSFNAQEHG